MRKLLNKPWFVAVVALVALLLVGHSVLSGGNEAAAGGVAPALAASATPAESEPGTTDPVKLSVRDALKALVIPANRLRDPFAQRPRTEAATVAGEAAAAPDLVDTVHLSALWTQGGATYSLINDRICLAGDEIGRLKIESATQEGVWLTHSQGRDFIALGGDFTLKTPADKKVATVTSTL